MKTGMKFIAALLIGLTLAACTLVPKVHMGVSAEFYGGEFHLKPHAEIGVDGYR